MTKFNMRKGNIINYNDVNKQSTYKIVGQGRLQGILRIKDIITSEITTIIGKFPNGQYNQFLTNART